MGRTLDLSVRGAYANAQAAVAALANATAADATAQDDLEAAKARLDAGVISPLAYRSGELTRRQAAQVLASARHAVILRLAELERTVLGGLDANPLHTRPQTCDAACQRRGRSKGACHA